MSDNNDKNIFEEMDYKDRTFFNMLYDVTYEGVRNIIFTQLGNNKVGFYYLIRRGHGSAYASSVHKLVKLGLIDQRRDMLPMPVFITKFGRDEWEDYLKRK